MIEKFNLTKENAKEYFFLNECREINIELGESTKADKFRSYGFDKVTLDNWTNEWLALKLNEANGKIDAYDLYSIIDDLGYRINFENAENLISIYYDLKNNIADEKKIDLLFKYEFDEVLKKHFYYGLIYIAARNQMNEYLLRLTDELNNLLKTKPQKIKRDYNKYLKKLYTDYGIKS